LKRERVERTQNDKKEEKKKPPMQDVTPNFKRKMATEEEAEYAKTGCYDTHSQEKAACRRDSPAKT
jgi:hypothetical protein